MEGLNEIKEILELKHIYITRPDFFEVEINFNNKFVS